MSAALVMGMTLVVGMHAPQGLLPGSGWDPGGKGDDSSFPGSAGGLLPLVAFGLVGIGVTWDGDSSSAHSHD
jgi:hypothetical protein